MHKQNSEENSEFFMGLESHYGAHNYHPIPVVLSKGEGVWVWDVEGKKYLDCLSAYSAVNQGHMHPKIVNAAKKQLNSLSLTSRAFYNDKLGPFLKRLCEFSHMDMALPMNTGAEAVETGIKIARRWGHFKKGVEKNKAEIIVAENNFHGRTTTIVSFTTNENSKKGFGPPTPGFITIPFDDPQALQEVITENTVAFLVEPIQGEAGVVIPEVDYLSNVRKICSEHNILLMLDEIQTGVGRTGERFAFEHAQIRPDILLVGKALSGGIMPISAALAKKDIMEVIDPGSHGSTFGGNPLASSVGIASLDVIEEEKLAENAAQMGEYLLSNLKPLEEECGIIKEIRGIGLFLAIEFVEEIKSCRPIAESMMETGVLVKETHKIIIRIAPPLIIKKAEIDWALPKIKKIIRRFDKKYS